MFERVIIVEDHDIANLSLRLTLEGLGIKDSVHAYYCDIALSMIRKAISVGEPYDLLITDLYFEREGSAEQSPDGATLTRQARNIQPDLKILVFSAENKPAVIKPLFDELQINGYVRKARGDAQDLKKAIEKISRNEVHRPRELETLPGQSKLHSFTDYDKTIIRLIYEGVPLIEIPNFLKAENIRPASESSMEKRLKLMRNAMGFNNNEQLVVFCREMGLI